MRRPEVRIVEPQKISNDREVSGREAEELLRKYGYGDAHFSTRENETNVNSNNLTFEEMIAQENEKQDRERKRRIDKAYSPSPITFDGSGGYDSSVSYKSTDGLNLRIEISTNMKL